MMQSSDDEKAVKQLAALIAKIKIAMLTTVTDEGVLQSRPITTQGVRFDEDLWFFTRIGSSKVEDLRQDRRVGLTYSSPSDKPMSHSSAPPESSPIRGSQRNSEIRATESGSPAGHTIRILL